MKHLLRFLLAGSGSHAHPSLNLDIEVRSLCHRGRAVEIELFLLEEERLKVKGKKLVPTTSCQTQ